MQVVCKVNGCPYRNIRALNKMEAMMSAITGIYDIGNHCASVKEDGRQIMKLLQRYPADDIQTWYKDKVFLGCHAQWITPESINEPLPYYDYDRQLVITADAIIDNRLELFDKLTIDRTKQKLITDSQLILLSYTKWGEECPKYLVGDFVFMIWDEKQNTLFGARDFSGGRTLYYHYQHHKFVFCTTIEPMFSLSYVEKRLNEQWLAQFLAISGMIEAVDSSITVFQDIKQLPPAHSISITGEKLTIKRYCTITSDEMLNFKSNQDYVEAFQEIFQQAVNSRVRTYRKVGAQLSGGLDSGSIVSFAARELGMQNKKLHTFSYIPTQDFQDFTPKHLMTDESQFIQSTLDFVGGIESSYLDFEGRNSFSEINDFLDTMEMPYKFFENSFWLKGMFEKAHEKGMGVLLNGGRGNLSVSWGSALDYYAILLKKMKWIRLFHELNQYSKYTGGSRLRRLPSIGRKAFPIMDQIFPTGTNFTFPSIINAQFAEHTKVFDQLKEYGMDQTGWFATHNIYEQRIRHFEDDFHWNASNTLATKLSLRYSLWKRDPTNDLRVIRFCLSVPEEQYVQNGFDRSLIRRSTKSYLPDKVRLNQRIRGVQGADWVHRMIPYWKSFISELEQVIQDKRIQHYMNEEVLKEALQSVKFGVTPEYAVDSYSKVLMRSLIVYRFIKKLA